MGFIASLLGVTLWGLAQTTTSEVESSVKTSPSSAEAQTSIDNPRLAAMAGARKKWFVNASFGYAGGSIQAPLSATRPNYRNLPQSVNELPTFGGSLNFSRRLDEESFVYASVGLQIFSPLHNSASWWLSNVRPYKNSSVRVVTFDGGDFGYRRVYQRGSLIQSLEGYLDLPVDSFSWDIQGSLGGVGLWYTGMVTTSMGWQFGVSLGGEQRFYQDPNDLDRQGNVRLDRVVGAYPQLEFNRGRLGWRLVYGVEYLQIRGSSQWFDLTPYMSTGINIAVRDDWYFYPNVQWVPSDARAERTNVGLSMTLNF